ncbi:MAG: hypothetical protein QOJ93_1728 [Actinomycetota bacterium]|nr:hypothetical protein [Actinomycetota bacterium]
MKTLERAALADDVPGRLVSGPVGALIGDPTMQVVAVTTSKDPNPKALLLLMEPGATEPSIVVKVPLTDIAEAAVAAEACVLAGVHHLLPPDLARTIPRVLTMVDLQGRRAMVATAVPGTPMSRMYRRWHHTAHPHAVRVDFLATQRWLARLQTATAVGHRLFDPDSGTLAKLADRFEGEAGLAVSLDRLAHIHSLLRGVDCIESAVHGDLWWGNLLMANREITGAVDWEAATLRGCPVRDVARFAVSYALYLDRQTRPGRRVPGQPGLRASWGAGVTYALNGTGWFPELFQSFVRRGLERAGMPPGLWRPLVLAALADAAAGADHRGFASQHLALFDRLATPDVGTPWH